MDERTRKLLPFLPLPEEISVSDAAEVLGGQRWKNYLMQQVRNGHYFSSSHSPDDADAEYRNMRFGVAKNLPKITRETAPEDVFLEGKEVLFRWAVEYESLLQGCEFPPKESIEERVAALLKLAAAGLARPAKAQFESNQRKLSDAQRDDVCRLYRETKNVSALARRFGVHQRTIDEVLVKAGLKVVKPRSGKQPAKLNGAPLQKGGRKTPWHPA